MRRVAARVVVVVGVGLALVVGCGGNSPPPPTTGKELLLDVKAMLEFAAEQRMKPPAKAADLEPMEPAAPIGGPAIRSGTVVYVWGAGLSPGGKGVVAYEKRAETEGGWVLTQDGIVKSMTAEEFKAAPKAK